MNEKSYQSRVIHWLAVLTAMISLIPIGMGSLVTTLGAGMVFTDWPTSGGLGMFEYPFFQATGDAFVEHGHRLAGILIGIASMVLVAACWLLNAPRNIKLAAVVVFFGVCIQGLIGGLRVQLDRQTIAFAHSVFGCCVFVALWVTALMTSRGWKIEGSSPSNPKLVQILAVVYPVVCLLQYTMGGFIRHLGTLLHEHVYGAVLVFVCGVCVVVASKRSGNPTLQRRGRYVGISMLLQVLLGVLVWRTKYGFPTLNMMAVQGSMMQVITRTVHTVVGMAVVTTAVLWAIQAVRSARVTRRLEPTPIARAESDHQEVVASA